MPHAPSPRVDARPFEEASRPTEAELQRFIEHTPAAVAMLDRDLRYLAASERWVSDYRLSRRDLLGRSHYEIFPEIPERWKAVHRRCLAGAVERAEEDPFPRADGSLDWIRWEVRPWRRHDGSIGGLIMLTEVVTERKRAEDALRESETRFRQVAENVDSLIWLAEWPSVDAAYLNPAALDLFGLTAEELRESPRAWRRRVPREDRRAIAERLAGLEPGGRIDVRYRVRRPDGSERVVRGRTILVSGADGRAARLAGVGADVTEREAAEERHAQLVTAMDQAGEGIAVLGRDGRIRYANPAFAAMMGRAPEALDGLSIDALAFGPSDASLVAEMRSALLKGDAWRGRYGTPGPDGGRYVRDATVSPVRDERGRVTGYVGVLRDVTRELELEEALRESQKLEAVGQLAGGIAHDMNNLLTVIAGYGERLREALPAASAERDAAVQVHHAAERAAGLTRQLLAFARRQHLAPCALDPNELLRGAEGLLRGALGEAVALRTETDPAVGAVRADPGGLEQVLLNLAVNARDAMPEGGTLTLFTAPVALGRARARELDLASGRYVAIGVADTGAGMDEATRARAFEPFFTTKEVGRGTGLGLAVAYGVARQSGGTLTVESEPGKGTTFRLLLPEIAEPVAAASQASASGVAGEEPAATPSERGEGEGAGATLLLAEDEPALRELVRELLEARGYTVLAAADGDEALARARAHPGRIDLLVADVVMPGRSGPELARLLAEERSGLRALFLSGYPDARGGAGEAPLPEEAALLEKPFTPSTLCERVREALGEGEG